MSHRSLGVRLALALALGAACALPACTNQESSRQEASTESGSTSTKNTSPDPTPTPVKENVVQVKLDTTMGDIVLELDKDKAPISTENFLAYVDAGSYDGTIFHRVIDGFMIQGGGFTTAMSQRRTNAPIRNEWQNGLSNTRYTVAMARLGGQADSATSQFFINVADNGFLDQPRDGAGYAVFGRVVEGTEVVDAIAKVATTSRAGHQDVPVEPVMIEKATRLSNGG
ncbi:MAG: peptidyl-prolyl cis-trans isomerase [Leptolyngbya sp. PLA3]|nr:MAG: peptidyl-prolyl cis-trans isomerase [Cyanobacteria bacterium CYA]MCE7969720.1 peptidyl-prolyl cis-trans isomerase [Leptolyngbya sp. PL-A3]